MSSLEENNWKENIKAHLYCRFNEWWDMYNTFKLGKSRNIPERDSTYITSEIKRGEFKFVVEVDDIILDELEQDLMVYFNEYNVYIDGGKEFFKKEIIELIFKYLDDNNIEYYKLTEEEISNLTRKSRYKIDSLIKIRDLKIINRKDMIYNFKKNFENRIEKRVLYIPRDYQEEIIDYSFNYFQENNKGILVLICGTGKTLISLWITQRLQIDTIIIGVPNILLLEQWEKVINIIYPLFPYLIVSGGVEIEDIINFINKYGSKCIIITTYSSSYKVLKASNKIKFTFGMKILDEVHHTTTQDINLTKDKKTFIEVLNIRSNKQLSLTATLKHIEGNKNNIISNNNPKYFGNIIYEFGLLKAINKKIVCDYVIQTLITDEEKLENVFIKYSVIKENDKRLFLSALCALKSIFDGNTHHLLIYCNNKDNSNKLLKFIILLLYTKYFNIPEIYYSNYHSEMNKKKRDNIIDNFTNNKCGIITCVYCLNEGWDFPILDGVVFSENMTSAIRIVQSALRASRKNTEEPDKITKIILPILNKDDWLENNDSDDFKKVKEIINKLGEEDTSIISKIKVSKVTFKEETKKMKNKKRNDMDYSFEEFDEEFTNKLKLRTTSRHNITFNKAKEIILEYNIKSKKGYYKLCEINYRLSKEPEIIYKNQFTNWIDYLSIERVYYDLETCKEKVAEYISLNKIVNKDHLNLALICKELCEIDILFPPNDLWIEYYGINNLSEIIKINIRKKKKGAIL